MSNRGRSHHKQHNNYTQGKYSRTPYEDSHEYNEQGFEAYGKDESSYTNRTSHARHTRTESFPVNHQFNKRGRGGQTRDGKTAQQPLTTRPKRGFQNESHFPSSPSQTNPQTGQSQHQPRSHTPSDGEWRPKTTKGEKADMVMFEHETLEKSLGSTEKKLTSGKTNKISESELDDSKEHADITIHDIKDASKHIHMIPVADKIKSLALSVDVKADSQEAGQRGGSAPPLGHDESKSKVPGNITIELPTLPTMSGGTPNVDVNGGHWSGRRHPSDGGRGRGRGRGRGGGGRGRGRGGNQRHEWTDHPRQSNAGYYRGALTPGYDPSKGERSHFPRQFPQDQRGGGYRQDFRDNDRGRHPMMYSPQTPDFPFGPVYGYGQQWYGNGPIQMNQNQYYPPQRQMRNDEMVYPRYNQPGYRGYAYTPMSMGEAQYYQQAYDRVPASAGAGAPVPISYARAQTPPARVSSKPKPTTESVPEKIKAQVEYYFSEDNLKTDEFLQGLMDSEGWVKARFLEQFPRLKKMQVKAKDIVAAVTRSDLLQTLNNKIRRKNDWNKFLPTEEKLSNRFLEAMAMRIEDHHAKLDKLKKLKGPSTEKKESKPSVVTASDEQTQKDNLPDSSVTEIPQTK